MLEKGQLEKIKEEIDSVMAVAAENISEGLGEGVIGWEANCNVCLTFTIGKPECKGKLTIFPVEGSIAITERGGAKSAYTIKEIMEE